MAWNEAGQDLRPVLAPVGVNVEGLHFEVHARIGKPRIAAQESDAGDAHKANHEGRKRHNGPSDSKNVKKT